MWQMSWSAVIAMVLYGLNNFLDGIFVGHLISNTALAAVELLVHLVMYFPSEVLSVMIPNVTFNSAQLMDFRIYMSVFTYFAFYFYGCSLVPFHRKCETSYHYKYRKTGCALYSCSFNYSYDLWNPKYLPRKCCDRMADICYCNVCGLVKFQNAKKN